MAIPQCQQSNVVRVLSDVFNFTFHVVFHLIPCPRPKLSCRERLLKYTCAAGGEYMEYLVLPQNSCSASRLAHFLTAISKDSGSADAETKTLNDKVDDIALRQDEQGSAFKGVDASPTAIKLADMAWEKEALLLRLFEAVMWDNLDNLSDAQSQSVWLPAHVTPLLFDPEIAVINCKKAGYYQVTRFA